MCYPTVRDLFIYLFFQPPGPEKYFRLVSSRFLNVMTVFQFIFKNVDFNDKKDPNKALRITSSTKVCSEQFQDNDVKFVDSRTWKIER